jgi:amino acid transporter
MTEPPAQEPPAPPTGPPPGSSPYGTPPPGYGPPPAQGYGAPPGYAPGGYGAPARNGMGTAALVLGILSLLGTLTVIGGFVLGLLALIFGIIGRKRAQRGEATNGGAALAGAIMGGIALAITILLIAVGATFFAHHKSDIQRYRDCLANAQTAQDRQTCADQFQQDLQH